ncbi:DoxX family protein [Bacillus sp. 03113]|uniref:DoxX family protein n=1 Tax=Bacillus sp. 03113 TaxID=2578211 RepID=UPI0011426EAB|nr:DoxX family membrane protein [Bacillus sp. 03113]
MAPFIVLVSSFLLFRVLGIFGWSYFDHWVIDLRFAVSCMFLVTASAHWGKRRPDLIKMVPPSFPKPELMVTLTGWLELIGAIGIILPATSQPASIGLSLMLLAMFPANIRAAKEGIEIAGKPATPIVLRTILQIIFLTAIILAGFAG